MLPRYRRSWPVDRARRARGQNDDSRCNRRSWRSRFLLELSSNRLRKPVHCLLETCDRRSVDRPAGRAENAFAKKSIGLPLASARFPASPKRRTVPSKAPVRRLGDAWDGRSPGWRVGAGRSAFPVAQWPCTNAGSPLTVAGTAADSTGRAGFTAFPFNPVGGTVLPNRVTALERVWQSGRAFGLRVQEGGK